MALIDVIREIAMEWHKNRSSNIPAKPVCMTRIGLISDTHGHFDPQIASFLSECDEIWHAGDFGDGPVAEDLAQIKPLRGVFGNIDGQKLRSGYPENLFFTCEQVSVFMRHIGGYPPRYNPETKKLIQAHRPQLFISGHSHILKIQYDPATQCLHMNPGAAGHHGWHHMRTLIRFSIDGSNIQDAEVIELGKRGRLS